MAMLGALEAQHGADVAFPAHLDETKPLESMCWLLLMEIAAQRHWNFRPDWNRTEASWKHGSDESG